MCTGEHPFYINNKGWVKARDLIENDEVIHYNEEVSKINKIYKEVLDTPEDTYNFEVEDYHTYYVTDSDVLVHNMCAATTRELNSFEDILNNPEKIWGKSMEDVEKILDDGWIKGTYGSQKTGWAFRKYDKMIAYHPGNGIHVGNYYKISSSAKGIIKVVGPNYRIFPNETAIIVRVFGGI